MHCVATIPSLDLTYASRLIVYSAMTKQQEVNPFVLDLAATENGDAPVLTARHGQGSWKVRKAAESFLEFLQKKVAKG